jgi:capsular polysaccharide biosynthesis protein
MDAMDIKHRYAAPIPVDIGDIIDNDPPILEPIYEYSVPRALIGCYGHILKNGKNIQAIESPRHRTKLGIATLAAMYLHKKRIKIASPVLSIANGWADSFYHFTLECLQKLYILQAHLPQCQIAFPAKCRKKFHDEWASLLDIVPNMIYVQENEIIDTDLAISCSFPARDLNHHHEILPMFRDWVLKKMNAKNLIAPADTYPKKIFINRQKANYRKITNYNAIEPLLMEQGYTIIDLEDYTLVEQINYFFHAQKIIGVHGAGFTHLCFSQAQVVDLIHEDFYQNCFLKMAKILDIPYTFLRCKGLENPMYKNSSGHNDLEVDIVLLKNVLK